jgi:hypothetical protein
MFRLLRFLCLVSFLAGILGFIFYVFCVIVGLFDFRRKLFHFSRCGIKLFVGLLLDLLPGIFLRLGMLLLLGKLTNSGRFVHPDGGFENFAAFGFSGVRRFRFRELVVEKVPLKVGSEVGPKVGPEVVGVHAPLAAEAGVVVVPEILVPEILEILFHRFRDGLRFEIKVGIESSKILLEILAGTVFDILVGTMFQVLVGIVFEILAGTLFEILTRTLFEILAGILFDILAGTLLEILAWLLFEIRA